MARTNTRKKRQLQKVRNRLRKVSRKVRRFQPDLYPNVNSSRIYNLDALQAHVQPTASAKPTASRRRVPKSQRMNNEQRRLTAAERLAAETAGLVGNIGVLGRGRRGRRGQANVEMTVARGKPLSKRAAKAAARALAAAENAELTRLLEASENQQNAVAANAVAHAEGQEAAVQSPFFRVPGYNRAAYHELLGYPALQRAEAEQRRSLLPSLQPNGGPRTFTPEELREMELVGFPRWAAEQDAKRGGRRTRRKGRGRSRR